MKKIIKPLKMKFLWIWILGIVLGIFIPYSVFDLLNKWNKLDITQIIIVIAFSAFILVYFILSIIFLSMQIRIIKRKRDLNNTLNKLKKDESLNKAKIKEIELEINTLEELYYSKEKR
ncbi:Uncharacterised protein [Mycoplasmopsis maculosa]|uniref:Uncharacterized protein n=1 Tax=Mycoplasmopsis maculosa TaxID=114885 RepID=A0A449B3X8_9BACT|nr:hypothetical protein [Mycoplasmopsis maculosa]VEU75297.1 Uncharacterised protein [Mycoplasmopsis maculosa]